jgi:hypothetical protein
VPTVKYHISPNTGRPNKCYATKRGCPLGSATDHYSSKQQARSAYEKKMEGDTFKTHTKLSSSDTHSLHTKKALAPMKDSPKKGDLKKLPKSEARDYANMLRQISARKAAQRDNAGTAFAKEFADIFCSKCGRELTDYSDDGLCDDCRKKLEDYEFGGSDYDRDYEVGLSPYPRDRDKDDEGWDDPDEDEDY